jgi:hypothetical protein
MEHPARIHEPGERLEDRRVSTSNQVKPCDCFGISTRAGSRGRRYAWKIEDIAEQYQIRYVAIISCATTRVVNKSGKRPIMSE